MTSAEPSNISSSLTEDVAPFRLLTAGEWASVNMPPHLTRGLEVAWAWLNKLSETEDVSACYEYLSHSHVYGYRGLNESRTFSGNAWEGNLAAAYADGLCSDRAYDAALNIDFWESEVAEFIATGDDHWGFHPLGLVPAPRYYMGKTGWCVDGVELPGDLGTPLLIDEWDFNLPDRGVKLRVVASGERKGTAYWSCDWVGQEDVPGLIANIMPYLSDADTFMLLHTLHHRQVDI